MRAFLVNLVAAALALSYVSTSAANARPASRTWIDRPWEVRYVLFAEEVMSMRIEIAGARKFNAEQVQVRNGGIYLDAAALFEPTTTFAIPGGKAVAVVLLTFDRSGRVLNSQGALRAMVAKRSVLGNLALIHDKPRANPYYFAEWSQGVPGDVSFSPAVCNSYDSRRYRPGWDTDHFAGGFGCREWTEQLYHRDQPYIDVTSYSPHGNFIGELVGWSRFEDPVKPVIGQQGKTWLCLHECPAGAKPGVIPDIKAWTVKHGYPMPERPPKQPRFPDADYKDDFNE